MKVTKEQVIEVERYCDEHGITRKQRISELGLCSASYYYTKRLLSDEELHGGQFLPVLSGCGDISPASGAGRRTGKYTPASPEPMTIEIRTPSGAEMRLTGSFSSEMLRTIMGNV